MILALTAIDKEPQKLNSEMHWEVVRLARQSIWELHSDNMLPGYLTKCSELLAEKVGKQKTDLSIRDVKRLVDSVYGLLRKLGAEELTLTQLLTIVQNLKSLSSAAEVLQFATIVSHAVAGNFGWVAFHLGRTVAKERLKRAGIVLIFGWACCVAFQVEDEPEVYDESLLDPCFTAMNREELDSLAKLLGLKINASESDFQVAKRISSKFSGEGKDQSLARAWFPKDAESYLEVLVAVAKAQSLNIRGLQSVHEIEELVALSFTRQFWRDLSEEDRAVLEARLKSVGTGNSQLAAIWKPLAGVAMFGGAGAALEAFAAKSLLALALQSLGVSAGVALPAILIPAAIGGAVPVAFEAVRAKPEKLVSAIAYIAMWRRSRGDMIVAQEKIDSVNSAQNRRKRLRRILQKYQSALKILAIALVTMAIVILLRTFHTMF